jgi:hypothetical protein
VQMRARLKGAESAALPGADLNHEYFGNIKQPEMKWAYVRMQLSSHSADAPETVLNEIPHLPLETYGTVFMTRGYVEGDRGSE